MVPCARILETARREQVDIIGLSGLITPSLEEMTLRGERDGARGLHASAPDRRGHDVAGAHRGQDRAALHGPTVHVLDASRAVGVAGNLLQRHAPRRLRDWGTRGVPGRPRRSVGGRKAEERHAVDRRRAARTGLQSTGTAQTPPTPCFTGVTSARTTIRSSELVPLIDWTPFFQTWELPGHYPAILDRSGRRRGRRSLFRDAQRAARSHRAGAAAQARAVVGFFPANSVGDDIELYADELAARAAATDPHPAPADGQAAGPAQPRARRLRGPAGDRRAPTTSAPSPSRRASGSTRS